MTAFPRVPLRRLITCLDGRRVPLNSEQRAQMPGNVSYWGAGSIVDRVARHLFDEELVLLGEDGAPFFDRSRDVAYLVSEPVWVNNHIHVLRPGPHVDPRFLRYALNSVDYGPYISGSTRDKLTQEDMKRLRLPLPTLTEQRTIADFLDAQVAVIDQIVGERTRQIELALEAAKASISGAVERRLLGRRVPLRFVLEEVDHRCGRGGADQLLSVSIHHGVVPRSEMTDDVPRSEDLGHYKVVQVGDVVLNRMRAFQGGVGVADRAGIVSPDYAVLRCAPPLRPSFAELLFRSNWFVGEMTSRVRGIGSVALGSVRTPRINVDDLRDILIPLPDLEEQQRVEEEHGRLGQRLSEVAARLQRSVQLLQEYKFALVSGAASGELEAAGIGVRGDGL